MLNKIESEGKGDERLVTPLVPASKFLINLKKTNERKKNR